jgi:hypothetical protein
VYHTCSRFIDTIQDKTALDSTIQEMTNRICVNLENKSEQLKIVKLGLQQWEDNIKIVMAQEVSPWPLTAEARVHAWLSPCGI